MDDVLGVIALARSATQPVDRDFAERVERLIEERQAARRRRDFAAADAIRSEIAALGVLVEDTPQGSRWRKA
jgi:cysteinyl-tRNA synthetase